MSFKAVTFVGATGGKQSRPSIGYQRHAGAKRKQPPRLIIGIPAHIASVLKIKDSDLFGLSIGDGNDGGKARIAKVAAGGIAVRKMKAGALVFRFGFVPMLGDNAAAKEFVEGRAIDGGFELTLPAWFKAD